MPARSQYAQKQYDHLKNLMRSLASPDLRAFIHKDSDYAWGILYHVQSNTILNISYNGVTGIGLGICLKPSRLYGTGYGHLEDGFRWINKAVIEEEIEQDTARLVHDLIREKQTQYPLLCTTDDIRACKYKNLDEYFAAAGTKKDDMEEIRPTEY